MHEHEEAAAKQAAAESVIESAEWTPGYVMGVVDESAIAGLKKKGLVVTVVETLTDPMPEGMPGMASSALRPGEIATLAGTINTRFLGEGRPFSAELIGTSNLVPKALTNVRPRSKILSADRKHPQYYVVRFHGSLTPDRKLALRRHKIRLLERVTRNRYTARLTPAQIKQLAALEFVDWLRLYDAADTLKTRETGVDNPGAEEDSTTPGPKAFSVSVAARAANVASSRMSLFSVRLHRDTDMPSVKRWLAKRKIKPLWRGGGTLRVALRVPGRDLQALSKLPEVASVEELSAARALDEFAQAILGLEAVRQGPLATHLRGSGEIIGIADTGLDQTHPDFRGRIAGVVALGRKGNSSDPEGHGTHVAGCAAGDGHESGGKVAGAAPAAKIFFQSVLDANGGLGGLPDNLGTLFKQAYAKGARIHNNSWGAFTFANYATTSLQVDRFVHENPDMLIVIAAGNDGIAVPRRTGDPMNSVAGSVDWPSVAAPATSKNGLTVGASRSSRTQHGYSTLKWGAAWADRYPVKKISEDLISGDDQCMAAFSSRGPSTDLQIKPDVVAPGTDIAAARSKDAPLRKFWGAYPNSNYYGFMGGTSMAAPYVSGCAALVREWYRKNQKYAKPSAALIKATLINGTSRITGWDAAAGPKGDPNYHQGFGRINLPTTLPNAGAPALKLSYVDTWMVANSSIRQDGDRRRFSVTAAAGTPLRFCLVWTDPPARGLQNSLALLVDDGASAKWFGNQNAAAALNVAGATADPHNNVQVVRIEKPTAAVYTIAVTGANVFAGPQEFALVVTGDLGSPLKQM
jgi:subtilisin family serine protease